jgi:hypothetical protein
MIDSYTSPVKESRCHRQVVHLRPTKGTSGASSISSTITESPAKVGTESSSESSAISDSISQEANTDTPVLQKS